MRLSIDPESKHARSFEEEWGAEQRLVVNVEVGLIDPVGLQVVIGEPRVSLQGSYGPQSSHYLQKFQAVLSPGGLRKIFIGQGLAWERHPEDAAEALEVHRREIISDLHSLGSVSMGFVAHLANRYLPVDGETPLTPESLQAALGATPFITEIPDAELVLLMRYLLQDVNVDRYSLAKVEDLLEQPRIPPYWILMAAAGVETICRGSPLPQRLASLEGLLLGGSESEYLESHRAIAKDPTLLGSFPLRDLVFGKAAPRFQDAVGETLSLDEGSLCALFRILGEEGHELTDAQINELSRCAAGTIGNLSMGQYRAGRLAAQIPPECTRMEPAPSLL